MDRAERFSDLYQRQYEAVLRYALRRTDPETARDVAAETFLVAWRRFDVVPAESGMAGPWLYGVARRVLANSERSRLRAERLTTRLGQERRDANGPDEAGSIAESDRIRSALATLSELDQEALRLVGWEELDLAAAALAMGCSRATMAVRLHRARRRLERALGTADRAGQRPVSDRAGPLQKISQETR
ncbi:MAG: RNA polymerase sigma factor [Streptosporangiaceae bacterium]